MKAAILFPGQGAQYVGMGKELYDKYYISKQIIDEADAMVDWNLKEVCFEDKNGLIHQTRYTQAALFTTNYAIYKALESEGVNVEAMLGFSLGEYDAITASCALDFKSTLQLVEKRATYMENCAQAYPGGMSAVVGMDIHQIKKACEQAIAQTHQIVEVANDNCKGQVTIAGEKEALAKAGELLKEEGAKRIIPLKVSGAFHSSLMKEAASKLKKELPALDFHEPQVSVISNVTARPMNKKELIDNIPLQVITGVRFRESIEGLLSQGVNTFIEVGPKCTLCNLVKKISDEVLLLHVEDYDSLQNVIEKVREDNA